MRLAYSLSCLRLNCFYFGFHLQLKSHLLIFKLCNFGIRLKHQRENRAGSIINPDFPNVSLVSHFDGFVYQSFQSFRSR